MASLQAVKSSGRTYWRIVESRRINGKPRPVPIMYLGTADALLDRLLKAPQGQLRVRSYRHGDIAALKAAADRLGIESIIDKHVRKRRRGLSVGRTLLLGAINRAVHPRSKRGWSNWAQDTSLEQLFPNLKVNKLTSQFFWDQMDCVELDSLRKIEDELTQAIVRELDLSLDTLFYDTTNFFTYIDSTNTRSTLTQRGHSKQKRHDLRLFSLGLLVSRDGQIPLCSRVYEGNVVDCSSFPDSLTLIRERLQSLSVNVDDVTLVYDKGNHSFDNQVLVDDSSLGYVASLIPAHHRDLINIPLAEYTPLPEECRLAGVPVLRLTRTLWGVERTVVLFLSEQLRAGQIRGLEQYLVKRLKALEAWKAQLAKPKSGPRTPQVAQKKIDDLLKGQFVHKVLRIEYDGKRSGADRLRYWIDQDARLSLENEFFGKRILVTNRANWSDEEIMLAYRGQSHVEDTFRQLKDDEHLAVRPQRHWTDQKVHVHTFMCLVALLLARVVEYEANRHGRTEGISGILDLLGKVRLAMMLKPSGERGGRPRASWQLEDAAPEALALLRNLVPPDPPFVYTDGNV